MLVCGGDGGHDTLSITFPTRVDLFRHVAEVAPGPADECGRFETRHAGVDRAIAFRGIDDITLALDAGALEFLGLENGSDFFLVAMLPEHAAETLLGRDVPTSAEDLLVVLSVNDSMSSFAFRRPTTGLRVDARGGTDAAIFVGDLQVPGVDVLISADVIAGFGLPVLDLSEYEGEVASAQESLDPSIYQVLEPAVDLFRAIVEVYEALGTTRIDTTGGAGGDNGSIILRAGATPDIAQLGPAGLPDGGGGSAADRDGVGPAGTRPLEINAALVLLAATTLRGGDVEVTATALVDRTGGQFAVAATAAQVLVLFGTEIAGSHSVTVEAVSHVRVRIADTDGGATALAGAAVLSIASVIVDDADTPALRGTRIVSLDSADAPSGAVAIRAQSHVDVIVTADATAATSGVRAAIAASLVVQLASVVLDDVEIAGATVEVDSAVTGGVQTNALSGADPSPLGDDVLTTLPVELRDPLASARSSLSPTPSDHVAAAVAIGLLFTLATTTVSGGRIASTNGAALGSRTATGAATTASAAAATGATGPAVAFALGIPSLLTVVTLGDSDAATVLEGPVIAEARTEEPEISRRPPAPAAAGPRRSAVRWRSTPASSRPRRRCATASTPTTTSRCWPPAAPSTPRPPTRAAPAPARRCSTRALGHELRHDRLERRAQRRARTSRSARPPSTASTPLARSGAADGGASFLASRRLSPARRPRATALVAHAVRAARARRRAHRRGRPARPRDHHRRVRRRRRPHRSLAGDRHRRPPQPRDAAARHPGRRASS